MTSKNNRRFVCRTVFTAAAIFLFSAVLFVSCATDGTKTSAAHDAFYQENISTFETRTLGNGIPLIVKNNPGSRILDLRIIVSGGTALVPVEKSGLEAVVFTLMAHGSQSYSYPEIMETTYETSSAIGGGSAADFSVFEMECIDSHFDRLFPVFMDSFLNPLFSETEFTNVINSFTQSVESRLSSPSSLVHEMGMDIICRGHPYQSRVMPTRASVMNISIDDVKEHHRTLLSAERIAVIAVGNYDIGTLYDDLNGTLGTLPAGSFTPAGIPPFVIGGPFAIAASPSARDIAYVDGFFSAPGQNDPDYIPFSIAAMMLDDIMFNIVREKYGAVYSIGTGYLPGKASAGYIWAYQVLNMENLKQYIDEALSVMENGSIILRKDEQTGEFVYGPIEAKLEGYKNKLVNSIFASAGTNSGTASMMTNGFVYLDDPADYLSLTERIQAVTSEDVQNAFDTYFTGVPMQWTAVTDEASIPRFDPSDYNGTFGADR